jgi:hypothetical protein
VRELAHGAADVDLRAGAELVLLVARRSRTEPMTNFGSPAEQLINTATT